MNMESNAGGSVVSIRITEKLRESSPISSEFSIFRVPRQLRSVNEQAYEPQIIAIGPYHHGKAHLQDMERHKIHYLRLLLQRRKDADHHDDEVNRYVSAVKALEERARECYAEPIPLDSHDFVEMMLLEGCFLVELIRKCCAMEGLADDRDPIFAVPSNFFAIVRDVMLLENQVPLFVLLNLFQLTMQPNESRDFISMVGDFVSRKPLGLGSIEIDKEGCYGEMHILSLVHEYWAPPNWRKRRIPQQDKRPRAGCKRIVCATKLRQAGVKLRSTEGGGRQTLLDVQFKDGTLFIPTMDVEDDMESLLRNLIAYEQLRPRNQPSYVAYYMTLMDCLIDTRADVELLCRCGIISNHLGDDEKVATLFKRLGDHVLVHHGYFTYHVVFEKVNKHCGKKWYRWVAKLRHDYFTSPWALLSLLAAFVLLLLTFIQTLYAGLSYY